MATKPEPRPEVLLSKLLALHLDLAIKRYKEPPTMSKFLQLAEDIEEDLRDLDSEAETLNAKRLENKEMARLVINDHHTIQNRVREGLEKMRDVANLGASNSRRFTAVELAEIARLEAGQKVKTEKTAGEETPPPEGTEVTVPPAPKLGEDSGDTSEASFPKTGTG